MAEFKPLDTMRFQSQLGKEMKRKYKEGNNLVTLSLADVVKVNYKYNTVDVITVRDKNSTSKNPNDNGRYSAMLPTHMSGRTANGNIYGSTTLVTVGTRVLIGFIDGQVDTPIVINIYGKTADQQELTRTEFTSADDSIESIQQELWNTFNLYPSMTYENVDGRGNREVTFSGKTFLISTDRDQENMYVQDAHFDYMDLPHSRYANGELIEPESPDAPTVLYVHQSIYNNHRTTIFIKSDGTFRLGSRHTEGGGITYQELKPDGSYSIVKKNDTENPEEESSDLSSIEILKDGNIVLQNPNTKMEVTDEGVLVNGKPIGSGGTDGGISPDLENIIKQINNQFSLIKITMSEIEGGLETKVEKDTYYIDPSEIEAKIKEIKEGARKSKEGLQESIESLVDYIANDVNTDNLTDVNKLKIASALDDMDNKKAILDNSIQTVLLDPFLTDEQKQGVKKWSDKLKSDHTALHQIVMVAMKDGKISKGDKDDIAQTAETYINDLNSWLIEVDKAADASYEQRIKEAFENAVNYANKESLHQSAVITQMYNMVSIKVSSEQVTQQFYDLNMKIDQVQTETATSLEDIRTETGSAIDTAKKDNEAAIAQVQKETASSLEDIRTDTNTAIDGVKTDTKDAINTAKKENQDAIDAAKKETNEGLDKLQKQIDDSVKNLPYRVEVSSSNGIIFVNGTVKSTLSAKITKGPTDVTSTIPVGDFVWTRVSDNTAADTAWNKAHAKSGRSFNIGPSDVGDRATFFCDYKNPPISTGSITIANIQDITVGTVEPTNPRDGALWYDRGTGIVWMWEQGKWVEINRFDVNTRNLLIGSKDYGTTRSNNPSDPNGMAGAGNVSGGWVKDGGRVNGEDKVVIILPTPDTYVQDTLMTETLENSKAVRYSIPDVIRTGMLKEGDDVTYCATVRVYGGDKPDTESNLQLWWNRNITTTNQQHHKFDLKMKAGKDWRRVFYTFKITKDMVDTTTKSENFRLVSDNFATVNPKSKFQTMQHTLVKGIVPADWVPAPEDTQRDTDNTNWNIDALGNDNYLTRFERGLVKTRIADITGESLSGTQDMKTSTQLDADSWKKGQFYAIRKQARDIAIDPKNDEAYVNLTKAYDALRTYLRALKTGKDRNTVYPWDTSSDVIMDVKRTQWDTTWNSYDNAYASLTVLVQQKQKDYVDNRIEDVDAAIKNISKTGQHATADLRVPTTAISAPITTIALPSFKGNTKNNLQVGGLNLLEGTIKPFELKGNNGTDQKINMYPFHGGNSTEAVSNSTVISFDWSVVPDGTNPIKGTIRVQGSGPYPRISDIITVSPDNTSGTFIKSNNALGGNPFTHINLRADGLVGTVKISNMIIAKDVTEEEIVYSPRPSELRTDGDYLYFNRNRAISGVTLPTFYTVKPSTENDTRSSMTIQEVFHGNGTAFDEFYWTEDGTPTKVNRFVDTLLDTGYFVAIKNQNVKLPNENGTTERFVQVELSNFANGQITENGTVRFANGRGIELEQIVSGNLTKYNQFIVNYKTPSITFFVSAKEMNVTDTYQVQGQDVAFFLRGWKMFQGEPVQKNTGGEITYTFTPYSGSDKSAPNFTPIGYTQKDQAIINKGVLAATNEYNRPVELASPIKTKQTGQQWQVVYQTAVPFESFCPFTGAIDLIGDPDKKSPTTIHYRYVDWTPPFNDKDGTFMYGTNLATSQEDLRYLIPVLERRVANAEQRIETDSIKSIVFSSREYELDLNSKASIDDMDSKANKSDITNLATRDELKTSNDERKRELEEAMKNIDFTPYVRKSEIEQLENQWTAAFYSSGGMNVVKNSIGFSKDMSDKLKKESFTFWDDILNTAYHQPDSVQTNALDALGFTSGFMFNESPDSYWTGIAQVINVIPNQPYTISYFLQKMVAGTNTRFSIMIQQTDVAEPTKYDDWTTIDKGQIADNSSLKHSGLMPSYFGFTPTKNKVRIVLMASPKCVALISGIMVNVGNKPIKWTMSTGENYNTNVRMNLNGIRVSQVDKDGTEIGYTVITPDKFAGYYIRDGKPEEVFKLDGDETWTKKLRAENEINMGPIKILRVENPNNAGWAFLSNN